MLLDREKAEGSRNKIRFFTPQADQVSEKRWDRSQVAVKKIADLGMQISDLEYGIICYGKTGKLTDNETIIKVVFS